MAVFKSIKLSKVWGMRSLVLFLALTLCVGYFLNRQEGSYQDEGLLLVQLISLGAFYFLLLKVVLNPLKKIFVLAEKVAEGNFNLRFPHEEGSTYGIISFSYNQLLEKIKNASQFIKSIEEGNLDAEYKLVEGEKIGEDALSGALLSMRDQMKVIEEETRERNWATHGLAKFVEILRANDENIRGLGDKIISNLVQYLNANQGGLFILNEEQGEAQLELVSCYAYNRKKFEEKTFLPGQGLVGQAYLEKETIYLTQVPNNYVRITSGLGEATPGSVILVPLKINEQVYGIIEMASFHKFEKYQIEFLEKLGESIASTISTTIAAERTKILLAESQQQAEEMRAQEEEMRQNMEELEATQEEMNRIMKEVDSSEKYLNEIINVSNDIIFTVDSDYRIVAFNRYFKDSMKGYGFNIEKGFDYLSLHTGEKEKANQLEVLKRCFAGESVEIPLGYEVEGGNEIHLISNHSPLRNTEGKIVAVAVYTKNVTEVVAGRKRAEKLLEEAQLQAQELEAQEEELRQNVEELTSMQEHQQKLQQELQEQVQQLEQAKTEIERVKALEKQRADEQIAKRNKLMEQTLMKFKAREQELLQQLENKNLNN